MEIIATDPENQLPECQSCHLMHVATLQDKCLWFEICYSSKNLCIFSNFPQLGSWRFTYKSLMPQCEGVFVCFVLIFGLFVFIFPQCLIPFLPVVPQRGTQELSWILIWSEVKVHSPLSLAFTTVNSGQCWADWAEQTPGIYLPITHCNPKRGAGKFRLHSLSILLCYRFS